MSEEISEPDFSLRHKARRICRKQRFVDGSAALFGGGGENRAVLEGVLSGI